MEISLCTLDLQKEFLIISIHMADKMHFSYNMIHSTVKKLSEEIIASGYDAELMVAIGSGGYIPARMMKTFINLPILAVDLRYYNDDNPVQNTPDKIQWIDNAAKKLEGKKMLLFTACSCATLLLSFWMKVRFDYLQTIGIGSENCFFRL